MRDTLVVKGLKWFAGQKFPHFLQNSPKILKVHYCRFENLPIRLCSYNTAQKLTFPIKDFLMENLNGKPHFLCNVKRISSKSRILNLQNSPNPVKFVNFSESRLIFILFYCLWMFVNKLFTYLLFAYLKKQKVF